MTAEQQQLAADWRRYAYGMARRFARLYPTADPEELAGDALAALCYAASVFDPARAKSFATLLRRVIPQRLWWSVCKQRANGLGQITRSIAGNRQAMADVPTHYGLDDAEPFAAREAEGGPEEKMDLRAAWGRLAADDRRLLLWRYRDGLTLREAGARIGVSREEARLRQVDAVGRLRELMGVV